MSFNLLKMYLHFTKYQRTGIFLLFVIIIGLQLFYWLSDFTISETKNPEKEKWVSLDIPLSDFTGLTARAHIAQLIYAAAPTGSATVYLDNVYFHN